MKSWEKSGGRDISRVACQEKKSNVWKQKKKYGRKMGETSFPTSRKC